MQLEKIEKLKSSIEELDPSFTPALRPQLAESKLAEVLSPLLLESGYQLEGAVNTGFDWVARKDVSADSGKDELAIEYKHYANSSVGENVVYRLVGAALSHGISRALLVTNSKFDHSAREATR